MNGSRLAAVEAQLASLELLLSSAPRKGAAPSPDKHPVVTGCWSVLQAAGSPWVSVCGWTRLTGVGLEQEERFLLNIL